jgi:hypothetical protein
MVRKTGLRQELRNIDFLTWRLFENSVKIVWLPLEKVGLILINLNPEVYMRHFQ